MQRYSSLVGKQVRALYRAGDMQFSASGVLAEDSGKAIYLLERFVQKGREKTHRLEIPYQCLVRLGPWCDSSESPVPASAESAATSEF
ncbi:MAG: hypothetical protein ACRD50_05690 [Candidatus Acidiferrales bacterium]